MLKSRYKQNTKYDALAERMVAFWQPNGAAFKSMPGKEKDYWRALAETHQDFDKVLDNPKSWEYVNERTKSKVVVHADAQ